MLFVNDQNLYEEEKKQTFVSCNYIAILNGLFHRRRFIHRDDCRSIKKHAQ